MTHEQARLAAVQLSTHLHQHSRRHPQIDRIDLSLALSVIHSALNQIDPPPLNDHPAAADIFQQSFLGDPHR